MDQGGDVGANNIEAQCGRLGAILDPVLDADLDGTNTSAPPTRYGRSVQIAVSLGVVALIFGFLFPKLADYGQVWKSVRQMTWLQISALGLVAIVNLVGYLPLLMSVLPGATVREVAVANFASTAISNTLPGGSALGVGVTVSIQRSFGIPPADIALGAVISGIWNNFAKMGLPVLALGLLAVTGEAGSGLTAAAVAGVVVLALCIALFALLLRSEGLAAVVGGGAEWFVGRVAHVIKRSPPTDWAAGAIRFRAGAIGLLKRRWIRISLATVLTNLLLYCVLLVAIRVVGVSNDQVGWIKVLAAFAFVRLISAIPITPGGIGVVELGLTAALGHDLGHAGQNQIAAAVLVYRALTWFAPIPLGTVSWMFWRAKSSWRHTVEQRRDQTV
jgi:uncharacterized membrane protein YbhN (UPF0104 family)